MLGSDIQFVNSWEGASFKQFIFGMLIFSRRLHGLWFGNTSGSIYKIKMQCLTSSQRSTGDCCPLYSFQLESVNYDFMQTMCHTDS